MPQSYPLEINGLDYRDPSSPDPKPSAPGGDECAVVEVTIGAAGRRSASYTDRAHPKLPGDAPGRVWFAPKEETATIRWTLEKGQVATGGRLEIFARGQDRPVWSRPLTPSELKGGELAYDGSADPRAFPQGFLTVDRSPYKLKLALTGPVRKDHAEAFTYFDVLIHSIDLSWGTYAMVPRDRTDVDVAYLPRLYGILVPPTRGYEETILGELKAASAKPTGDAVHRVILPSDLYAKKPAGAMEVEEYTHTTDHDEHRKLWGNGTRIPIIAKVLVKKSDGGGTDQAPEALAGCRLLWDWDDRNLRRWREGLQTTAKTEDFLRDVFSQNQLASPKDTNNCPSQLGGKLGGNVPVFPTQSGTTAFPYQVEPCQQRTWDALSHFKAAGTPAERCTSGVLFQPSRIAGDRYKIVCALLFDPALETRDDIVFPASASASAGTFEVFRKITLNYLVRGSAVDLACDPAAIETKIKEIYLKEGKMIVDCRRAAIDNDAYKRALRAAVAEIEKKPSAYTQFPCMPLLARNIVNFDPPANSPGVVMKTRAELITGIEAMLQAGRLRQISVEGMLPGEELRGARSGNRGLLVEPLSTTRAAQPVWLLVQPGAEIVDQEEVQGQASGVRAPAQVSPSRSCWGHTYAPDVVDVSDRYDHAVDVDFGGRRTVTLTFAKTGFKQRVRTVLDDRAKAQIQDAMAAIRGTWDEMLALTITLTHKGKNSDSHRERIANVKAYIDELLVSVTGPFTDRKAVFERLRDHTWGALNDAGMFRQNFQKTFAVNWLIQAIVEEYVKLRHPNDEGVFLLHIPGRSNARDLVDLNRGFQDLRIAGAFYGDAFFDNRMRSVTYIATLDPNGPSMYKEETKSIDSIFAHELGHALFLPHAPRNSSKATDPAQSKDGCHVKGDNCLMNYDVDSEHFCAICMLRLRGWNWSPLPNTLGEQEYQVTFELDDINSIFSEDASSPLGRLERLQVLGFVNRPLDHPEIRECAEFAWSHFKEIHPQLEGSSWFVQREFFTREVREFVLENQALPPVGRFARIWLPALFQVGYSQNHLEARIPPEQQGKDEARPYERFMLGASRFAAEQAFYAANPALGKIPLKATVRRRPRGSTEAWVNCPAARGAKVYFELVTPDDVATAAAPGAPSMTISGAKAHWIRVQPPPLKPTPLAYLNTKVTAFKPSPPTDPDAGNVHKDIGGKRGGPVFCKTRREGFGELPYDSKFKFAAVVDADEQGVARVVFAPSAVGGDCYRLRVFVGPPTQDRTADQLAQGGDDVVETGTMVRWRTLRVCHDLVMPPAMDASEVPAESCKKADGSLMPNVDRYFGALPDIDLRGALTTELAKSYTQLLIEPAAEQRVSLALHGADVEATAIALAKKYPKFNTTAYTKTSIHKEPLPVVPGTNDRQFRTVLLTVPEKGTVSVRPSGGGPETALIVDKDGVTDTTPQGANVLVSGAIRHNLREVEITLRNAVPGARYEVCYHPAVYVDLAALLDWPATSPFLFNLALPRVYNPKLAPGTKPADGNPLDETARPASFHAFLDAQTLGLVKALLLDAATRGVGKSGGFYPGLLFFHARRVDNYTAIWETGTQEGKGVGNGIFLFDVAGSGDPARFAQLCLHEMSHGLGLMHAPTAPGNKPEQHDPADNYCVMSYDANDGDHCGQCVAALRGINTGVAPFR